MKILDWLDRVFVTAAMGILVAMMCLTTISVFGRYFFGAPIPDVLILSEHLMVFRVFLPLGAVQAARQHVFVTIFTEWMSNETKVVMETIGVMVGFFIFLIITCAGYTDFQQSWEVGAYSEGQLEAPEPPARFAIFVSLLLLTAQLLIDAVIGVRGLINGNSVATKSEEARVVDAEL
jgi:TRAP-type C4-dicarboxylate transport system permease small subunit